MKARAQDIDTPLLLVFLEKTLLVRRFEARIAEFD
jgi:hypothetical protein